MIPVAMVIGMAFPMAGTTLADDRKDASKQAQLEYARDVALAARVLEAGRQLPPLLVPRDKRPVWEWDYLRRASQPGQKDDAKPPLAGAIPLSLNEEIRIEVRSKPVKLPKEEFSILDIGTGTFQFTKESRLKGKLKASAVQYSRVDYWIYAAVFDAKGQLLATASHKEEVQYLRAGATPTFVREIDLDFGVSQDFKTAAFVVITISNPDVPAPPK